MSRTVPTESLCSATNTPFHMKKDLLVGEPHICVVAALGPCQLATFQQLLHALCICVDIPFEGLVFLMHHLQLLIVWFPEAPVHCDVTRK